MLERSYNHSLRKFVQIFNLFFYRNMKLIKIAYMHINMNNIILNIIK